MLATLGKYGLIPCLAGVNLVRMQVGLEGVNVMVNSYQISGRLPPPRQAAPVDRSSFGLPPSPRGVLPTSISASDVGQTFLSAGSGDFPVPGFRVKLSALVREVGKLRNRQARKPALPFGQHARDTHAMADGSRGWKLH